MGGLSGASNTGGYLGPSIISPAATRNELTAARRSRLVLRSDIVLYGSTTIQLSCEARLRCWLGIAIGSFFSKRWDAESTMAELGEGRASLTDRQCDGSSYRRADDARQQERIPARTGRTRGRGGMRGSEPVRTRRLGWDEKWRWGVADGGRANWLLSVDGASSTCRRDSGRAGRSAAAEEQGWTGGDRRDFGYHRLNGG